MKAKLLAKTLLNYLKHHNIDDIDVEIFETGCQSGRFFDIDKINTGGKGLLLVRGKERTVR